MYLYSFVGGVGGYLEFPEECQCVTLPLLPSLTTCYKDPTLIHHYWAPNCSLVVSYINTLTSYYYFMLLLCLCYSRGEGVFCLECIPSLLKTFTKLQEPDSSSTQVSRHFFHFCLFNFIMCEKFMLK